VPFYINTINFGAKSGINHDYFIGIRNIEKEKTVRDIAVRLIGCDSLVDNVPMLLEMDDGESKIILAPKEMRLVKFATQYVDAVKGGGFVMFHGANKKKSWLEPDRSYRVRLGAYGDDANAFVEIAIHFDERRQIILPQTIGDYPEGEGQHLIKSIQVHPPIDG
jgi:hypothetical protein